MNIDLIDLSIKAGKAILQVYNSNSFYEGIKEDNSPLTEADIVSNKIIISGLKEINIKYGVDYPILSEESKDVSYTVREKWDTYWLVDPLDGTKEFIKRNGEFTTNIALVKDNSPVLGFVYTPVSDVLYWGDVEKSHAEMISGASNLKKEIFILNGSDFKDDQVSIIASRSHMNNDTKKIIDIFESKFDNCNLVSSGSSLKLCKVAEGKADLYPRFAPTMEWDTAAADAVCRASGCGVYGVDDKEMLLYNKENLLNPYFYVTANNEIKKIMESI